jgi:Glycosidases
MRRTILSILALLCTLSLSAQRIDRVEPPCWWIGMDTDLQLMLYGRDLKGSTVKLVEDNKNISVSKTHDADSDDYLFVDVKVTNRLEPGEYTFELTTPKQKKVEFKYVFGKRAENSGKRESFGPADVVYLIVPDRFSNSDDKNDSVDGMLEKADRGKLSGRHGGDIQGICDRLDYISELGATTIWCTPMLMDNEKEYSYHGYACSDFYTIDPRFGSNDLYKQMVEKAHNHGLKVIMDVVLNHCGTAHWWMKDPPFEDWINHPENVYRTSSDLVRTNASMSTHFDPYASQYDKDLCISGWFDTSMPDMNLSNPFVLKYMIQMAVWWVEFANLDGLRVDTFPYSEKEPLAKWTKSVLDEYKNLNIVAECWYGDPVSCSYWEGTRQKDGYNSHLPSVMDFPLREAIIKALTTEGESWNPSLVNIYNTLSLDAVYKDPSDILIFAGNHDTNRLAHLVGGDLDKIKMAYTILATMRGVPQIYYGDELAMRTADGSTGHSQERLDFEDSFERVTPEQTKLLEYIATMLHWRADSEAITKGGLLHFRPTAENVYVYFRYTKNEAAMVILNGGKADFLVDWERFSEITSKFAPKGKNIITREKVQVGEDYVVPAGASAIIEFKK